MVSRPARHGQVSQARKVIPTTFIKYWKHTYVVPIQYESAPKYLLLLCSVLLMGLRTQYTDGSVYVWVVWSGSVFRIRIWILVLIVIYVRIKKDHCNIFVIFSPHFYDFFHNRSIRRSILIITAYILSIKTISHTVYVCKLQPRNPDSDLFGKCWILIHICNSG